MASSSTPGARRRAAVGAVAVLAACAVAFLVVAPPERCPAVTTEALRGGATEAVGWIVRNQRPNGTWLYEYDADTDTASASYNVVRHAGVTMSLYQAASASIPGALESADRGLGWVADRIVERESWSAVKYEGATQTGTAALLTAGLVERRLLTEDRRYDDLMERLGRFLVAQTEPSGAVLAYYDDDAGTPLAGVYSKYYTGEAYWALTRLAGLFPDGPWGQAADRVGTYLATRRDDAEGHRIPVPDHWAAYGLAETVADDGRLSDDQIDYARRQAGSFGAQVRWVSQRFGPWGALVRGPSVPRGGGYGVIGEALTGLWVVARADPRLHELTAPIAERATCAAGLALSEQTGRGEATDFTAPERVQGAWFRDGTTRMDDQQHALSALLRTVPIVEAAEEPAGGSARPAASPLLWLAALLAAFNPVRAALGTRRPDRSRSGVAAMTALGGAAAAVAVLVATAAGWVVLDAGEVSDPSMRIAAGAIAAVVGVTQLFLRPPSPEPALDGWRGALVPVAVPLVAGPALVVLAIGAVADRGPAVVALALAVGTALLALLASSTPTDGGGARVVGWAGRTVAAGLVATSVLLVIDGVFAV